MNIINRPEIGPGYSHAQIWRKGIATSPKPRYSYSVAEKSATGRENPELTKATVDALSVFFIVAISAHLHSVAYSRTVSMVALVGQLSGWPVPFVAGILTPISVTTLLERENSGGDSLHQTKEIATMAITPTPSHPKFTFIFLAVRRTDLNDRPHRKSITAPDELTARQLLARDFVLLFAGRVPAQGVCHV